MTDAFLIYFFILVSLFFLVNKMYLSTKPATAVTSQLTAFYWR